MPRPGPAAHAARSAAGCAPSRQGSRARPRHRRASGRAGRSPPRRAGGPGRSRTGRRAARARSTTVSSWVPATREVGSWSGRRTGHRWAPGACPGHVDGDVVHDRQQPRPDRRARRVEGRAGPPGADQRFLGGLLGQRGVPENSSRTGDQPASVRRVGGAQTGLGAQSCAAVGPARCGVEKRLEFHVRQRVREDTPRSSATTAHPCPANYPSGAARLSPWRVCWSGRWSCSCSRLRSAGPRAARGSTVLVLGEAGIGKTSLLRAFLGDLSPSVRVLTGACEDLLTPRPLSPLREAVQSVPGPLADALAAPPDDPGEVFAAAAQELGREPGPTVLVVEDAHWADGATLDALRYLGPPDARAAGRAGDQLSRRRARPRPSPALGARRPGQRRGLAPAPRPADPGGRGRAGEPSRVSTPTSCSA